MPKDSSNNDFDSPRESFIPIHVLDLVQLLSSKIAERGEETQQFLLFSRIVLSLLHQQYRRRHQNLTRSYALLDPDRDVPRLVIDDEEMVIEDVHETITLDRDEAARNVFDQVADLLERANYRRLSPRQIQAAVGSASHWGVKLRVRFSMFRRLEVYARGDVISKRTRRPWYKFFLREETEVPIYQRLLVIFRVKEDQRMDENLDSNRVNLRAFKNIPKFDIDMLLPGTGVRMSWLDRGKVGIPTLWGLAVLIWKIIRNASLLAIIGVVKVFANVLLIVAVAIALIVYAIKSAFSYTSAKRRYQLNVARNLYYQNLDNNLGALLRLLDEAEQQEGCEAILGYYCLTENNPEIAITSKELDDRCEAKLKEMIGADVDFDVDDAINDLSSLGLIQAVEGGWKALPLPEALKELDRRWDHYFFQPNSISSP